MDDIVRRVARLEDSDRVPWVVGKLVDVVGGDVGLSARTLVDRLEAENERLRDELAAARQAVDGLPESSERSDADAEGVCSSRSGGDSGLRTTQPQWCAQTPIG